MSIKNNKQKLKQEFQDRNKVAELGGGKKRIADQHKKGKFTARERIEQLCDPGSFMEFDKFGTHKCQNFGLADQKFYGDGVVTGFANIDGRRICIFAQDFTVFGGALSEHHAYKICKMMDQAANLGCPVIGLCDSGGARIQEGVESLAGYADIFLRNTMYSGVVPQISVILGPCAGGAVYSPAITDFVIMAEGTSHMFITGPEVIKTVTRENVDKETLGGAKAHMEKSGVTHFVANNEQEALGICKKLLSYLPQNSQSKTTKIRNEDPIDRKNIKIDEIIPDDENKPYDMLSIISEIADTNSLTQVQEGFAQNIITAFVRLNGRSVGVVANQPKHLAGCLDIDASCKAARFVRFCNAFNIPILTLVDVPGFLPGVRQEHGGIIRHGAKLLFAFAEATVPKVTIVVRKAYGGAYDVMSSKHLRGDVNLAYPTAEIAVMGSQGAVAIIHKKELEEAEAKGRFDQVKQQLIDEYKKRFSNPWVAAELGFIDAIILPEDTRHELIKAFDFLENKKVENILRRNSNIPL